jgi:hypothetical protein
MKTLTFVIIFWWILLVLPNQKKNKFGNKEK